jgi:hypothetical protein
MLKRLVTLAIAIFSGLVLVGTPAHTFDARSNLAPAKASTQELAGKCYVGLWSASPRLFGIEFKDGDVFRLSFCDPEGTFQEGFEFLVFTLWDAEACDSGDGPIQFEGVAIASPLLLFRAEGPTVDARGIGIRAPCSIFDRSSK